MKRLVPPFDPLDFSWPPDWRPIPPGHEAECALSIGVMENIGTDQIPATNFVDELRREMCPEHPLAERAFVAIASSTVDPDDILFFTDDTIRPFALVHLSWHVERTGDFPYCRTFPSLAAFMDACSDYY